MAEVYKGILLFIPSVVRTKPCKLEDLQRLGRQILLGLQALAQNGVPYPQLSLTNVVFEDKHARLSDVENTLLGLERPCCALDGESTPIEVLCLAGAIP